MHYPVFVYGDNVVKQLEPFKENSDNPASYVIQPIFKSKAPPEQLTNETILDFILGHAKERDSIVIVDDSFLLDENGYLSYELIKYYQYDISTVITTNSQGDWDAVLKIGALAQWDWFVFGGRWAGYLILNEDYEKEITTHLDLIKSDKDHQTDIYFSISTSRSDQWNALPKKMINTEAMCLYWRSKRLYDVAISVIQDQEVKPLDFFQQSKDCQNAYTQCIDYPKAIGLFMEQPAIVKLCEHPKFVKNDLHLIEKAAELVDRHRDNDQRDTDLSYEDWLPYASLRNGEWVESFDKKKTHWESAEDDEWVTIVDIHI